VNSILGLTAVNFNDTMPSTTAFVTYADNERYKEVMQGRLQRYRKGNETYIVAYSLHVSIPWLPIVLEQHKLGMIALSFWVTTLGA